MIPAPLRHYYDLGLYYLGGGMLVAIAEQHTKPAGRILAQHLLRSGHVDAFFMEMRAFAFGGTTPEIEALNAVKGKSDKAIQTEIDNCQMFSSLSASNAAPRLPELCATALAHGTDVYAADPEQYRVSEWKQTIPTAMPARNEASATMIRAKFALYRKGGLMLWGADHFKDPDALHKLVRGPKGDIPVMLLNVSDLS